MISNDMITIFISSTHQKYNISNCLYFLCVENYKLKEEYEHAVVKRAGQALLSLKQKNNQISSITHYIFYAQRVIEHI